MTEEERQKEAIAEIMADPEADPPPRLPEGSIYLCGQTDCGQPAVLFFTWPGHPRSSVCGVCALRVRNTALVLGFHIHFDIIGIT